MTQRKTRKASWLLTVASAYSMLPGCSDDPAAAKPDSNMESHDGGVTVSRPPRSDAATTKDSGNEPDDDDVIASADDVDFTTLIGVILFPPGGGDLPELDAGATDTPPAEDASADASGEAAVAPVVLSPDAAVGD